jgi:hypothetical protein
VEVIQKMLRVPTPYNPVVKTVIGVSAGTNSAAYFSLDGLERLNEPVGPWSDWLARPVFAGRFSLVQSDPTHPLQGGGP